MKFNIIKTKWIWLSISIVIIIIGSIFAITKGFRLDIDFKGGTNITAQIDTKFNNNDIENLVDEIIGVKPLVQKVSKEETTVSITTDVISNEQSNQIIKELKTKYSSIKEEPSIKNVQPAYTKELVNSALKSLTVGMFLILIYIWVRFRTLGISASLAAIIALMHDVLIMGAVYTMFQIPINSVFIAAILTIIGYSINDTIVIYDRIRENKKKLSRETNEDVINTSIKQTVKRSLYTSITTVLCIAIVYILAVINNQEVLKNFAFPLMIGIVSGTYSSIFIASPLWYMFSKIEKNKK